SRIARKPSSRSQGSSTARRFCHASGPPGDPEAKEKGDGGKGEFKGRDWQEASDGTRRTTPQRRAADATRAGGFRSDQTKSRPTRTSRALPARTGGSGHSREQAGTAKPASIPHGAAANSIAAPPTGSGSLVADGKGAPSASSETATQHGASDSLSRFPEQQSRLPSPHPSATWTGHGVKVAAQ